MSKRFWVEATYVTSFFLLWTIPFAIAGQWGWFGMFATIGAVFGGWEIASKITTGRTLSQRYYKELRVDKPVQFWVISFCLLLGWLMLLAHLIWDIPGGFF